MEILIIYLKEQFLIKHYVIKHLILNIVYQKGFTSTVSKFFDKKSIHTETANTSDAVSNNQQLEEELYSSFTFGFLL